MRFSILCSIAVCFFILHTSCKNESSSGSTFNVADTSSVSQTNHQNEEDQNSFVSEEGGGVGPIHQPGNRIEFTNAGNFLSSMLYYSVMWQETGENSNSIQIKLIKNQFSPLETPQDFEPKNTVVKCASFHEGFGALADAFYMAYEPKSNRHRSELIAELAGLSYTRTTTHSQPFDYINHEMIHWCWNNFYRTPNSESFCDASLNTIYDVVFKKFIRTLSAAHVELEGSNFENEKSWYRNSVIMEKDYAPELLNKRYVKPEKYDNNEMNSYYYPYACGFWLRRDIDESAPVIWNYVRMIIMDYDYAWGCKNLRICDRG
jgi:hypothetical protein